MDRSVFPILKDEYVLIRQHGNSMIYPLYSPHDMSYSSPEYSYMTMNKTAAELLTLCDGDHAVDDIISIMKEKYHESEEVVSAFVSDFFNDSYAKGYITISSKHIKNTIRVYGDFCIISPINACFEITKRCPLRCMHCYNSSGYAQTTEVTIDEIRMILDILSKLGVQKLMITGGEPTQRIDFLDIIEYAAKRFVAISVGCNGYLITESLVKALSAYKNKVVFQISIDGMEKNHNYIRGVNDSFKRASDAICLLRRNSIPVTVATTLNSDNFGDMEKVAEHVHALGALQLSFAITTSQGRARENGIANSVDVNTLVERAIILKHHYMNKGLYVFIEDDTLHRISSEQNVRCGAGVSHITVRENGDVSPCLCFFYSYGNLLSDSIYEIFSPKNAELFSHIPVPSKALCGNCDELDNCNQCHGRAYDSKKENCEWRKQFYNAIKGTIK